MAFWVRKPHAFLIVSLTLLFRPSTTAGGRLAAQYANVYIDTNSLPLHGLGIFREAMATWLNYVSTSKIMCAHDGTSIEMAVGSSLFTREVLGELLPGQSRDGGLTDKDLRRLAADMLHNNAVAVYGIGKLLAREDGAYRRATRRTGSLGMVLGNDRFQKRRTDR